MKSSNRKDNMKVSPFLAVLKLGLVAYANFISIGFLLNVMSLRSDFDFVAGVTGIVLVIVASIAISTIYTTGCSRVSPGEAGIKVSMAGSDKGVLQPVAFFGHYLSYKCSQFQVDCFRN